MKAIQCPSCKKHNPGDFSECLACGESLKPRVVTWAELQSKSSPNQPTTAPVEKLESFCCPKCSSTHLTGNKKGFGLGKSAVGGLLLGGIGLFGGFIGSRKVTVTCMECGHSWNAGKNKIININRCRINHYVSGVGFQYFAAKYLSKLQLKKVLLYTALG